VGAAGVATGLVALGVGLVVATTPLWSGRWNAAAQATAARRFLQQERRAAVTPAGATGNPAGTASGAVGTGTAATATPQTAAPAPGRPVAAGQPLARLVIPVIGADTYVLEGLTFDASVWEGLLQRGPAHLEGSALPGRAGNVVIFGHVNVWGSVFQHLHRLRPGDPILLETPDSTFTYVVTGSQLVPPTDAAAVRPHGGPPTLQLVTCAGLWDTQRLIVEAALVPAPATAAPVAPAVAESLVAAHEAALLRVPAPRPAPRGLAGAWMAMRHVAWGPAWAALRHTAWAPAWRSLLHRDWGTAWAGVVRAAKAVRRAAEPPPPVPPAPLHFTIAGAWPLSGGQVRVVVREEAGAEDGGAPGAATAGAATAGAGTAGAGTAGAGTAGAGGGRIVGVLAYTVGPGVAGPVLLGVRAVAFRPPVVVAAAAPAAAAGWTRGTFGCAGDVVHWWVGPVQPMENNGFTFEARSSSVTVIRPDGMPLTGIALPGLAEGTVPVACGDLTGDGTETLLLQTVLPPETAGAPAASAVMAYRLGATQAALIGQMLGVGSTAPPRLVRPAPDLPYRILVPQGTGPAQAWVFGSGSYVQAAGAGGAAAAGKGSTSAAGSGTPAGAGGAGAASTAAPGVGAAVAAGTGGATTKGL